MRLLSIELRNFKGIEKFDLEPNGRDLAVHGDNATGKTTLVDAFLWLLFGKDSANRAQFDIKTLDESGEPRHGLEHSVEATLQLDDGRTVTLAKAYKELWQKKRGSATKQFTGHTTDHEVDSVPVKKAEFDAKVAELADEGVFRLLTDPTYFNTQLHWEDRRRILLDVCGDVTDREVIASDEQLARLPDVLENRSIDDHRKKLEARRREVNKELERLPVRIDEAQQGKPEPPDGKRADVEARVEELRQQRGELEQEKARTEAGGQVAEKQASLRDLEGQLHEAQRAARAGAEESADQAKRDARAAAEAVEGKDAEIRRLEARREEAAEQIQRLEQRRNELRTEWQQANDRTFHHDADTTCPACGQDLPPEKIQEAHDRAREEFNAKKATELERIQTDGLAAKAKQEELEKEDADLADALEAVRQERATLAEKAEKLQAHADDLAGKVPEPGENPEAQKLQERIDATNAEIEQLKADASESVDAVGEKIRAVDADIEAAQAKLASLDQIDRADARIHELTEEEKKLAGEYERIQEELYLLEAFTRAKVQLLEAKINAKFELARFKLFTEQVNGGLEETCHTTYQGVPFESLNHGARLNVGIDILNTLADHYGFVPPVFVDNAESVTSIQPTRGQCIKLVVSAADKKLRIEEAATPEEVLA